MRWFIIGAALALTLSSLTVPANAVPITYDFAGIINSFSGGPAQDKQLSVLPGSLGAGVGLFSRPLSGSITVDSAAAVDFVADPGIGSYRGFDLISAFSVSIEGFEFALDTTRADNGVSAVVFDGVGQFDRFNITAFLQAGVLPGPASILSPRLRFDYIAFFNPDIITSDLFPTDLTQFRTPFVSIDFFDARTGDVIGYGADLTSLTPRVNVSTAGTALLFGLGMLGLWFGTSRQRVRLRPAPGRFAVS